MSLSLIGIIFVQAYYIKDSVNNEKKRFKLNVKRVLSYVSNTIETRELDSYFAKFEKLDKEKQADSVAVSEIFFQNKNKETNERIFYRSKILEEDYKLSSTLFDLGMDSIDITRIITSSKLDVYNESDIIDKDIRVISPVKSITSIGRLRDVEKYRLEKDFKALLKKNPIYRRIKAEEIKELLSKKLKESGIDIGFEFAVYSNNGLATKIRSDNFEYDERSTESVSFLTDENKIGVYRLLINFPDDGKYVFLEIIGMILLSVVFTLIIVIAYSSALYQLVKQRKISEIKTDFINNMTHEFKTPIATINLALDAIKNPKIIEDKEKVLRYLNMIKDENKRMHAQVENVLRISKLEKNELNISKDKVDLHDLVQDAITHVQLLVEDRNGTIIPYLKAEKSSVLASEMHFTNVIVNILDNAIKYSPNALKIEVFTENIGTNILLKIKDHGSGMSKAALKRVFEKFYREHTGNIHNVKGHGLGLAYVKRIVDDHQGHVTVESEKGKGSTFIIKLPIIT